MIIRTLLLTSFYSLYYFINVSVQVTKIIKKNNFNTCINKLFFLIFNLKPIVPKREL